MRRAFVWLLAAIIVALVTITFVSLLDDEDTVILRDGRVDE
jgi:hypothetical protein